MRKVLKSSDTYTAIRILQQSHYPPTAHEKDQFYIYSTYSPNYACKGAHIYTISLTAKSQHYSMYKVRKVPI